MLLQIVKVIPMNRTVSAILGLVLACLGARAEVVLNNTTTGTGNTSSSSGQFSIDFTAPANGYVNGVTLYNSSNSLGTFGTVSWTLTRNGGASNSKSFTSATLVSGNTITGSGGATQFGYLFDFSGSEVSGLLSAGSYNLSTTGLNSGGGPSGWSFAAGSSITGSLGFTDATYTVGGDPNYNFQLSGVPEPGTLALGAFAALAGALAWWWRGAWIPA